MEHTDADELEVSDLAVRPQEAESERPGLHPARQHGAHADLEDAAVVRDDQVVDRATEEAGVSGIPQMRCRGFRRKSRLASSADPAGGGLDECGSAVDAPRSPQRQLGPSPLGEVVDAEEQVQVGVPHVVGADLDVTQRIVPAPMAGVEPAADIHEGPQLRQQLIARPLGVQSQTWRAVISASV